MSAKRREVRDGKQACIGCGEWKAFAEFYKHGPSSTGRAWRCKECHRVTKIGGMTPSERAMKWARENPERAEALNAACRARVINDVDRLRARRGWYRKWYAANREAALASHRAWLEKTPWAVVADRCRTLVRMTLAGQLDGGPKFRELVGMGGNEFRKWIVGKWEPGMGWHNFGRGGWTLGHVVECAWWREKLMTEEWKRECFNWKNLQPEWERNNRAKHTAIELTKAQRKLL